MASRKRIYNIDHNCYYDSGVITLGISNCAITWVEPGVSVRCLTDEERREAEYQQQALKLRQEESAERLANTEVNGLSFSPPKTTKYRFPREAYEALELPLAGLKCRWPRMEAA